MLILAYLGQGACLITKPSVISSIFYLTIPGDTGGALYWVVFVFAILATLIASQAMITATFSLVHQLIGMRAFPAMRIKHTSNLTAGQVYIAPINWLMMVGTIAVVGGFGSSGSLTLAYGFAVATVLFVTTTLIALSISYVKHLTFLLGIAFLIFFGFLDGLFWGASLKKVPHGAWFPLGLGGLLCILIVFWSWCRQLEDTFDDANTQKLSQVISAASSFQHEEFEIGDTRHPSPTPGTSTPNGELYLRKRHGSSDTPLAKIPVMAIFHRNDSTGRGVPHSFASFLQRYPALPAVVIFLTTRVVGVPHVPEEDKYVVNKVRSFDGFYSVTMRNGYHDRTPPSIPTFLPSLISLAAQSGSPSQVETLQAISSDVTHVIPSYEILSAKSRFKPWSWVRKILVEDLYGRARVIFPDWSNSPGPEENNMIHVSVAARI
ncbi:potassium transporter-domain-containing protein [Naematelia encephala]|uniref:Potassium transporter-domain-containing protein n=1 Tax=Naematelia encephala TaxID=71784 RepID=A0A1Y2BKP7_9TREE|nr:potassium transporter-domain-containing protein [Naematelia encephala]